MPGAVAYQCVGGPLDGDRMKKTKGDQAGFTYKTYPGGGSVKVEHIYELTRRGPVPGVGPFEELAWVYKGAD